MQRAVEVAEGWLEIGIAAHRVGERVDELVDPAIIGEQCAHGLADGLGGAGRNGRHRPFESQMDGPFGPAVGKRLRGEPGQALALPVFDPGSKFTTDYHARSALLP